MDHMTKEHKKKELSVSDLVSGRVAQWTFRINLLASNETASPSHLFHYITAIDNRQDDAFTGVSEISDDEYDEEVLPSMFEVHSRYDHRVIRDLSNNSGDEDDASTKVSETNDTKIEEEVDKASVKLKFVSDLVSSCNLCDKTFFDKNELD